MSGMAERPTSRFAFDRSALLYVVVTFLLGIGSLHSQNNLLFIAFGVAIGVLLVNGAYAQASLASLKLERSIPERGEVDRSVSIRYRLTSRARWLPAAAVLVEEIPSRPDREAWGGSIRAAAATVARNAPAVATASAVPSRRGELTLDRIDVSSRFPFGAVKKTLRFRRPARLLIRPRTITPAGAALRNLTATVRSSPASVPRVGSGEEILGLRDYVEGDELRKIAWRASARHGRWVVREHAMPATRSVILELALDPELPEEANEEAISLAAGAVKLASRRSMRVGLLDPRHPAGDGNIIWKTDAALDALALVDPARSRPVGDARATLRVEAHATGPRLTRTSRGARTAGAAS
jgi:uncharacterized protein (DUF58 family)